MTVTSMECIDITMLYIYIYARTGTNIGYKGG